MRDAGKDVTRCFLIRRYLYLWLTPLPRQAEAIHRRATLGQLCQLMIADDCGVRDPASSWQLRILVHTTISPRPKES